MAFNPVLQSQIQPEQTPVQPDSTSFAAGALGTVLNIGSGILQGQQNQQAAQQKAFVTEKVSSAALPLADLFSNAGSGKGVRIAQQTREYENSLREQGFSDSEIVEVYKIANSASGTSYSAANKADRSAVADQIKAEEDFRKNLLSVLDYVPNEYRNDDGTVPLSGPEAQAAFYAAIANKGQFAARKEKAQTISAENAATQSTIDLTSAIEVEETANVLVNIMTNETHKYDRTTPEGMQQTTQAIVRLRAQIPVLIDANTTLTRSDKDKLKSAMDVTLTALEDNITGASAAKISNKQIGAMMQSVIEIAMTDPDFAIRAAYAAMNIPTIQTQVDMLGSKQFAQVAQLLNGASPNSKPVLQVIKNSMPNATPEEIQQFSTDLWASLHIPTETLTNEADIQTTIDAWSFVLRAPTPADQRNLFSPNGMYIKSLDILRNKDNAEKFGPSVLGNPDFQDAFTTATSTAISTYVPLAMNATVGQFTPEMKETWLGENSVKEITMLSANRGYVQFKLPSVKRDPNSPVSGNEAKMNIAASGLNRINLIFKQQYEAAVQIDRVSGSKLAEQIRNAQLRTASLYIQVPEKKKGQSFSNL
jgi:hypothetical protein